MKKLFTFIIIGLCVGTAYGNPGGKTSQAPARKQRLSDGTRIEDSINSKLPTTEAYQVFVTTSAQETEVTTENVITSSVTFSDGTVMISTAGFGGASFAYISEDNKGVQISSNIIIAGDVDTSGLVDNVDISQFKLDTDNQFISVAQSTSANANSITQETLDRINADNTIAVSTNTLEANKQDNLIYITEPSEGVQISSNVIISGLLKSTTIQFQDGTILYSTSTIGGGWVGTAESDLDMNGNKIIDVSTISFQGSYINNLGKINFIGMDMKFYKDPEGYYPGIRSMFFQSTTTSHPETNISLFPAQGITGQKSTLQLWNTDFDTASGGTWGSIKVGVNGTLFNIVTDNSGDPLYDVTTLNIGSGIKNFNIVSAGVSISSNISVSGNYICADGTQFNSTSTLGGGASFVYISEDSEGVQISSNIIITGDTTVGGQTNISGLLKADGDIEADNIYDISGGKVNFPDAIKTANVEAINTSRSLWLGYDNTTTANKAYSFGNNSDVSGFSSMALGIDNTVHGLASFVIGKDQVVDPPGFSFLMGDNSRAWVERCYLFGNQLVAQSTTSVMAGRQLKTSGAGENKGVFGFGNDTYVITNTVANSILFGMAGNTASQADASTFHLKKGTATFLNMNLEVELIRFEDGTEMTSTSTFGGGGWVGTATSDLNMADFNINNSGVIGSSTNLILQVANEDILNADNNGNVSLYSQDGNLLIDYQSGALWELNDSGTIFTRVQGGTSSVKCYRNIDMQNINSIVNLSSITFSDGTKMISTSTITDASDQAHGFGYVSSPADTVITQDVYTPILGTYTTEDLDDFTFSGSTFTYTGTADKKFLIEADFTVINAGTADTSGLWRIAKNGVTESKTTQRRKFVNVADYEPGSISGKITLSQNDKVSIWVTSTDGDNIRHEYLYISIVEVK